MRLFVMFLFFILIAVTACGKGNSASGENTLKACEDGIDNDGDGYTDCYDQDCFQFVICLNAADIDAFGKDMTAVDTSPADLLNTEDSVTDSGFQEIYGNDKSADSETGGCDPCGNGTVTGVVCAPNGKDVIPDALVTIDTFDCEGKPLHLEIKSDYTGAYSIKDVPCGSHTINISKGSFTHQFNFYVEKDTINDTASISGDRCMKKDAAKILVMWGQWDTFQGILDLLGFAYDFINFEVEYFDDVPLDKIEGVKILREKDALKKYDILFMNCGSWHWKVLSQFPEVKDNIKNFVLGGGSLYMSDLSWVYSEAAFPLAIDFMGNDASWTPMSGDGPQQMEGNQTVDATINDGNLGLYVGTVNFTAKFDEGPLIVVDSGGESTFVHIIGYIKQFKKSFPLVLSYQPASESGRVIYTTFHNDAQATELMKKILYYLVFLL